MRRSIRQHCFWTRLTGALAGLCLFSGVTAANAEDLVPHFGPELAAEVDGAAPGWALRIAGGWAVLSNDRQPTLVFNKMIDLGDPGNETRRVRLKIMVTPKDATTQLAHAGIAIGMPGQPANAFLGVGPAGEVALFRPDPNYLSRLTRDDPLGPRAKLDGQDVLEVEIEPTGRVNFFLNGERLVYEVWPGGPPRMVGVSAMGMGRFAYDGFTVTRTRPLAPGEGWGSGDRTSEVDEVKDPAFQIDDLREAQVLLGVTFGVLLHEFGHAVIGELELPATGPEEDVADGFAALALGASLSAMPDLGVQIEPDFLEGVVEYSVLFWYHSGRADQRAKRVVGWQGEHAPDIRRFRTAFCLVYSSNPDRFEDIADRVSASDRTKQRCFVEWKKQSRAWLQLLKPHRRSLQRADAIGEGGHIMVTFVEPRTQMGRKVADLLQTGNLLANFLRMMEQEFVFPRDMRVVFRHCDEPNAFYNPELGMIIMCFEAIEYFARITLAAEDAANPLTLGTATTATTASAGTEETGNSEQRAAEVFLAGEWEAVLKIGAEDFPAQAVFADDRGFSMRLPIEDVPTEIEGEWQVSPVSPGRVTLALRPSSWSPREICPDGESCRPHEIGPIEVDVQFLDGFTIQISGNEWKRQL